MHLATGLAEGLDAAYESRVRSEEEHVRLGVPSLLGRPASRLRLAAAVDGIVGEAAKRGLERVDRGAMLQELAEPTLPGLASAYPELSKSRDHGANKDTEQGSHGSKSGRPMASDSTSTSLQGDCPQPPSLSTGAKFVLGGRDRRARPWWASRWHHHSEAAMASRTAPAPHTPPGHASRQRRWYWSMRRAPTASCGRACRGGPASCWSAPTLRPNRHGSSPKRSAPSTSPCCPPPSRGWSTVLSEPWERATAPLGSWRCLAVGAAPGRACSPPGSRSPRRAAGCERCWSTPTRWGAASTWSLAGRRWTGCGGRHWPPTNRRPLWTACRPAASWRCCRGTGATCSAYRWTRWRPHWMPVGPAASWSSSICPGDLTTRRRSPWPPPTSPCCWYRPSCAPVRQRPGWPRRRRRTPLRCGWSCADRRPAGSDHGRLPGRLVCRWPGPCAPNRTSPVRWSVANHPRVRARDRWRAYASG